MEQYIIKGGHPLVGEVEIGGAKNAALAILAAAIMTDETVLIDNLPDVNDINVLIDAIEGIGAQVHRVDRHTVKINGASIKNVDIEYDYIKKIRASYYLLGALLGKYRRAEVALPGGCNIGSRPIDQHLKGFRALGADVDIEHGKIVAEADRLVGKHIYFDVVSVAYDWIHALTMPRELEWKDGKILQHPLKEMKDLRKNAFTCELEAFTKWAPADCCFELRLDVEEAKNLELKLREDVTISWKDGLFTLSMGESGRGRKQRFAKVEELSDITIFSDTSAIEIFINNGETVLTTRVYSEHLEQKVELVSREVKGSVHGYELGSFEVEYKK